MIDFRQLTCQSKPELNMLRLSLLLIICLSPSALFIVSLRKKIGRFFLISVKISGLSGLNVKT